MKWTTAISRKTVFEDALFECAASVRGSLGSGPVTLALAFVTPHFAQFHNRLHEVLMGSLGPETLLGCSWGGVIGGGEEAERLPAVTLTAARLPDVVVRPFHLDGGALPDLDGPPDSWENLVGAERSEEPQFVLLADPFTSRPEALLAGLDYAFPGSAKIGGLASGGTSYGLLGSERALRGARRARPRARPGVTLCRRRHGRVRGGAQSRGFPDPEPHRPRPDERSRGRRRVPGGGDARSLPPPRRRSLRPRPSRRANRLREHPAPQKRGLRGPPLLLPRTWRAPLRKAQLRHRRLQTAPGRRTRRWLLLQRGDRSGRRHNLFARLYLLLRPLPPQSYGYTMRR